MLGPYFIFLQGKESILVLGTCHTFHIVEFGLPLSCNRAAQARGYTPIAKTSCTPLWIKSYRSCSVPSCDLIAIASAP